MSMTPRGLRRLDEGHRATEELEHRQAVGRSWTDGGKVCVTCGAIRGGG